MTTTVTAQIQLRKGTAAQWTSANPTLLSGEIGFETDTLKLKIGDGTTAWTALAYHHDPDLATTYAALAHTHSGVYEPANANLQSHVSSTSNPHSVSAAQVGADASGTASGLIASHESALDPHPGYALESSLGGAALLSVGTTTGTVAAGDDARFATGTTGDAFASSHQGGNQHIDWTADQGATNVHAGNIPDLSGTYAAASHNHAASAITSGTLDTARLGSGTANSSTYLRGDQTWAAAAGGVASDTHAATEKTTPVDADELPLVDSAASWVLKKLTWANLKTTLTSIFVLLAGKSGGQTLIGGTGVTDKLVLQGTSGDGTSTSTALEVKVGNNGVLSALNVLNNGQLIIQGDATTDGPVYGSELLTSAGWTVTAGWTESPDDVFAHSSGTTTLSHSATITSGYKYQISWTITGRTAGSITIAAGGQSLASQTVTGAFGPTATSTAAFTITPTTDFDGTVSLVSLRRITAASVPEYQGKDSVGNTTFEMRWWPSARASNALGVSAQQYLTTGSNNTALGTYAQQSLTTGSYNTALGANAGCYCADGSTALTDPEYSVYIGANARGKDNADNNSVVIGGNTPIGLGANTTVIGTSATILTRLYGDVSTGIDAPGAALHAVKTTEQLRLGYDASNYASFTVSSAGNLTIDAVGGTIYTPDTIENTVNGGGIVLRSPDGTRYLITVANGGTLTVATA